MVETIKVEGVNAKPRFGKLSVLADGVWFNLSDKCDMTAEDFKKGQTLTLDVYTSPGGKKYINGLANSKHVESQPVKTVPKVMLDVDRAALNERILRQGIYQAVIQSPTLTAFVATKGDLVNVVVEVAEAVIKRVKGE